MRIAILVSMMMVLGCTSVSRGIESHGITPVVVESRVMLVTYWLEFQPKYMSLWLSDRIINLEYAQRQALEAAARNEVFVLDEVETQTELPLYWLFGRQSWIVKGRYVNPARLKNEIVTLRGKAATDEQLKPLEDLSVRVGLVKILKETE